MTTSEALLSLLQTKVTGLDASRPLTEQLNSLEIFSLVDAVEKEFKVSFMSIELNDENLRSVDTWAKLIETAKLRQ